MITPFAHIVEQATLGFDDETLGATPKGTELLTLLFATDSLATPWRLSIEPLMHAPSIARMACYPYIKSPGTAFGSLVRSGSSPYLTRGGRILL